MRRLPVPVGLAAGVAVSRPACRTATSAVSRRVVERWAGWPRAASRPVAALRVAPISAGRAAMGRPVVRTPAVGSPACRRPAVARVVRCLWPAVAAAAVAGPVRRAGPSAAPPPAPWSCPLPAACQASSRQAVLRLAVLLAAWAARLVRTPVPVLAAESPAAAVAPKVPPARIARPATAGPSWRPVPVSAPKALRPAAAPLVLSVFGPAAQSLETFLPLRRAAVRRPAVRRLEVRRLAVRRPAVQQLAVQRPAAELVAMPLVEWSAVQRLAAGLVVQRLVPELGVLLQAVWLAPGAVVLRLVVLWPVVPLLASRWPLLGVLRPVSGPAVRPASKVPRLAAAARAPRRELALPAAAPALPGVARLASRRAV